MPMGYTLIIRLNIEFVVESRGVFILVYLVRYFRKLKLFLNII